MENSVFNKDFYPTPKSLIYKMIDGLDFNEIDSILEPSAGKGDICEYILGFQENRYKKINIDVIEIVPDLQKILKQKEYNLVFDNFLEFDTHKTYDQITERSLIKKWTKKKNRL